MRFRFILRRPAADLPALRIHRPGEFTYFVFVGSGSGIAIGLFSGFHPSLLWSLALLALPIGMLVPFSAQNFGLDAADNKHYAQGLRSAHQRCAFERQGGMPALRRRLLLKWSMPTLALFAALAAAAEIGRFLVHLG